MASVQAKEQKSGQALVDESRTASASGSCPATSRSAPSCARRRSPPSSGCSRTPVREALRQLQSGGLITVVPNRGAVVHVPSPWDVRAAHEVRAELEGLAAERAATRISDDQLDRLRKAQETMRKASEKAVARRQNAGPAQTTIANDEIHTTIHEAARNPWLAKMIIQVNESFPRNVLSLVLAENPVARRENVRQHDEIIDALAAGDGATARDAMRRHVLDSGEQLARWYEERSTTVLRP